MKVLEKQGLKRRAFLRDELKNTKGLAIVADTTGLDAQCLAVNPLFGRMHIPAGYDSAAKIASANAGGLCDSLGRIDAGDRFFKGKIGLSDIKRLVKLASFR